MPQPCARIAAATGQNIDRSDLLPQRSDIIDYHETPFALPLVLGNLTAGWLATIGNGATGTDVEPAGTGYINL